MEFLFFDHVRQLEAHYRKTKAFAAVQREIHVEKFYAFLEYAGRRAVVLVVKGDHDDDFPGAYDVCRINRIPVATRSPAERIARGVSYFWA